VRENGWKDTNTLLQRAQSFPFDLFNGGGGTSSRLPIGCVLIQSRPKGNVVVYFFKEKEKNINFCFIFIFNLLFCWKKPHRRAATHLALVPLSWTFAVYL